MSLDHATLYTLRDRHPAWRLLASPHAPLVASFLRRVLLVSNVRVLTEGGLTEVLKQRLEQASGSLVKSAELDWGG